MPTDASPLHLLCFGFGFTAETLARRLETDHRGRVSGTRRTLVSDGSRDLYPYDGQHRTPALADLVAKATHVLISIPPDTNGCPVVRHFADDLSAAPHLAWIGYLSTVGVYGDTGGAWVDEDAPVRPRSEQSVRRALAEQQWLTFGTNHRKRVEIFRLPGIYGPGRSAIDQVRAGTARRIDKPGQVFNRIHVTDIARALEAAWSAPHCHAVYNVVDDLPAPAADVVAHAASLLGSPCPPLIPFTEASLSPMARSFYSDTKRVSNARLKGTLGFTLLYPTYREGLAAIMAARDDSASRA